MIASMTGYARAQGSDDRRHWVWEARSVNGRNLEVRCRVPQGLDRLENHARGATAGQFKRGNISLSLIVTSARQAKPLRINKDLLGELATHALDVVIADVPAPPHVRVKVFSHLLGESDTSFFAAGPLATKLRRRFPRSLNDAPVFLPTRHTALRRAIDQWLEAEDLRPRVVGEFDDSALMKAFGQAGVAVFPAPSVIEPEVVLFLDEARALVTLQENNAVAYVDLVNDRIVRTLGLPEPVLAVGDGSTDVAIRVGGAADAFAAYTGFVARPDVVAAACRTMS